MGRSFKVFIIVVVVAATLFFLLNYYLPSKIDASSPALQYRHLSTQTETQIKSKEVIPAKKSIADELGITRPKTTTLSEFNPKMIKKQKKKIRKIFEIPPGISDEVNFWKDVYTKYDKSKVIFHDKKNLDIIYSVLDLSDFVFDEKLTDGEIYRRKQSRVGDERGRLIVLLKGMEGKDPESMSKEEIRIYQLYAGKPGRTKFKDAARSDRLRSQTGIKEKFTKGIQVSGRYLGEIEKIFAKYGIPLEVSRLAFVESMFNLEALSKVGASGIWQFMPSSGRLFMTIDQIVDERNDPILATHGAAKHLRRDYDVLQNWPLAINSYNSGRGRLARAVSKLGTTDIATIIKKYDGPGYAFASRNFYPAFLAALHSFENREELIGKIEMDPPLSYDIIEIPFFTTLPELAKYTGVPVEELVFLNFHFQDEVRTGKLPIPIGFELKVPVGKGEDTLVAINEMNQLTKYAKWHIVESKESLKTIAAKYKTNMQKLKRLNGIRKNHVKTGQILKLPEGIALAKE